MDFRHFSLIADMKQTSQMEIIQLVKGAKNKDQHSIEILYKMYYPKMKGVCIKIIKADKDIAHDLVQNAFIHALVSLNSLNNEERFGEWLTTITRNISLKYLQQKNKIRFIPLSELSDAEGNNLSTQEECPESLLNLSEIKLLIRQLPKGFGEVFRLYVIEGYSHLEIGKMLGIAPHSSSSQLARAKALLRQMLKDKGLVIAVLSLLFAVPCGILWMYHEKSEMRELAEEKLKTKKEYDKRPFVPSDSIEETPQQSEAVLAKGTPHRVVIVAKDNVPDSIAVADSTSFATSQLAETQASVVNKLDSIIHILNQTERYIAEIPSKSHKSEWQLTASGTICFEAEQNNNLTFAFTDEMPEPDGPVTEKPQAITTWEQYAEQLSVDVFENPTEENKALFDVAQNNSGKVIEQEHHSNPISVGIALSRKINMNLSVETGVQYDRLNSIFKMGNVSSNVTENQSIDYLGIPLRMTYRMYSHKRFNVYGTAGVMFHIPLKGSSRTNYMVEGQNIYRSESSLSAPLQWTVPLGVGAQYQFTKHISIYAQPTLNWHIPSSSNVRTMWTEHPWHLTIPVGIRFTW